MLTPIVIELRRYSPHRHAETAVPRGAEVPRPGRGDRDRRRPGAVRR